MVKHDNRTLVIRHIPKDLSKDDKIELLKFFGATEVKCTTSKHPKTSKVFASFQHDYEAEAVMKKLHQEKIFGQLLSVEYARGSDLTRIDSSENERVNEVQEEQTLQRKYKEIFLQKLNSWTNDLDFHQPPPVHFKYQYPPPTLKVLTNIAKVLACRPRFYTQVLHLMNKMNLPCPFSESFNVETELVPSEFRDEFITIDTYQKSSGEESEIESDGDTKNEDVLTLKRKQPEKKKIVKKPKLFIPQPVQSTKPKASLNPDEIFEQGVLEAPKKIEVKVSADLTHLEGEKEEIIGEGFEKVLPVAQPEYMDEMGDMEEMDETEEMDDDTAFITAEQLAANRIAPKDLHILAIFKNYHPGVPSCRLYVKNLDKKVTVSDLRFIYRRYLIPVEEEQGTMFDVQLLQEGRMKGQAFISLQNIDQAKLALTETNGYILKSKPMVVQYARSSKPKQS